MEHVNKMMSLEEKYSCACDHYDNNEYNDAFELFLNLANQGDLASKKNVANMFLHGIGTEKNEKLAYEWYEQAAKSGDFESQYWYGNYLLSLNCIDEGLRWIELSASNNFLEAIYDLGGYYFYGLHVNKDQKKAIKLYEKAALYGHKRSFNDLINATAIDKGKTQAFFAIIKMVVRLYRRSGSGDTNATKHSPTK